MKFIDSTEKEEYSRMVSFFWGILPTVENDDDTVEFQYLLVEPSEVVEKVFPEI